MRLHASVVRMRMRRCMHACVVQFTKVTSLQQQHVRNGAQGMQMCHTAADQHECVVNFGIPGVAGLQCDTTA